MASSYTALGAQLPEQQRAWVRESLRVFRESFFFQKFTGTSDNSIVQVVNELKSTPNGDRAMIGLVQDLKGSGVVGDNDIEGSGENLESDWVEIHCDQLRKRAKSKGRVDDQRSVFGFRKEARDKLGYWRARINEEMAILTASGVGYQYNTDGSTRTVAPGEQPLSDLDYAADIVAPSSARHFAFNGTSLVAGDTTTMTSAYIPKYGMIVDAMAEARVRGIKPLMVGGKEYMCYLCHPKTFARLKKDADFRDAVINANERGTNHPIFTGATVTMDGAVIHINNRVYNTNGKVSGTDMWGSGNTLNGTRSLLLGCQALAMADIWGSSKWFEGKEDDDNKSVISIAQYSGWLKPQFVSRFDSDSTQDFGLLAIDLAL